MHFDKFALPNHKRPSLERNAESNGGKGLELSLYERKGPVGPSRVSLRLPRLLATLMGQQQSTLQVDEINYFKTNTPCKSFDFTNV